MLERLRRAMVESYVGAVALGYLLAQVILHFVNVFTQPFAGWITRKQYGGMLAGSRELPGFSLKDAVPELIRFVLLIVAWYVLVRWLYVKPVMGIERKAEEAK
jgi:hypothetical protein